MVYFILDRFVLVLLARWGQYQCSQTSSYLRGRQEHLLVLYRIWDDSREGDFGDFHISLRQYWDKIYIYCWLLLVPELVFETLGLHSNRR